MGDRPEEMKPGFRREMRLLAQCGRQVWHLVPWRHQFSLAAGAGVMAVTSACNTAIALVIGLMVDAIKRGTETGLSHADLTRTALTFLGILAGAYVGREVFNVFRRFLVERACTSIDKDLTVGLVAHLMKIDLTTFTDEKIGSLHGRIQRSVMGFVRFLRITFLDFAPAVLTGVFMFRHELPAYLNQPAVVGWVADDSPAQKAGFQPGDKIVAVQDKQNPTWDDVRYQIFGSINQKLDMDVQRGDQMLPLSLAVHLPEKDDKDIFTELGLIPAQSTTVNDVAKGEPAEKAGIRSGDQIIAVNGTKIQFGGYEGLSEMLQKIKENPAQITIERNGERLEKTLVPQFLAGSKGDSKAYRLGVYLVHDIKTQKLSFPAALRTASVECRKNSTLIFKLLGDLVSGKGSLKNFGGPLAIAQESGRAAQLGLLVLLQFMSLISLNLAIFNLLPIPILDGGLMLMLLVEGIMRRDIKQQVKERVYQAAFVFLVLFAAVVIYNDVAKTLPGGRTSNSQSK